MIDNEKNETRKNEKQTKEELLKKHALNDDDLEKVSGGWGDAGYETQSIICPKCGHLFYAIKDCGYLMDIICPLCNWSHDDVSLEASVNGFYTDMFL